MTEPPTLHPGPDPGPELGPSPALDPLTLPLQGSRLIEASAGTGKTWTIAALVLRLVTGHGCTPRAPGEILVMTFTKAATRELASRIRDRLAQAASAMRGEAADPATGVDGFMAGLREAFPAGPLREQAAWRLAMAAEAMDDASVFTIDAWCQRMLREHAFDSGSLFDETLQADETALRTEAVRDVWRQQVYPLPDELLARVLPRWKDVDALAKDMAALIDKPLPDGAGLGTLAGCLVGADDTRAQTLRSLKNGWAERVDEMEGWLAGVWDQPKHPARQALPARHHAERWLQALRDWAANPELAQPDVKGGAERFRASDLRQRLDALGLAPLRVPPAFNDFETLLARLKRLPDPQAAMRLHMAAAVRARLQDLKTRAGTFGFADALHRLDEALDVSRHGERAQRLRERIVARYPVAMVDEFQDTSPLQLRIFERLYRIADDDPARTLLLIGDPKQAIYGFRGADIHSYLQARAATAGRHHALGTNHRSSQALVDAVNRLFQGAEHRGGDGAFLFGHPGRGLEAPDAGTASPVPFAPVKARGRPERLVDARGGIRPITIVADARRTSVADARRTSVANATRRDVKGGHEPKDGPAQDEDAHGDDAFAGNGHDGDVRRGARDTERLPTKADSQALLAGLCAERIAGLLNDPAAGFETLEDGSPCASTAQADGPTDNLADRPAGDAASPPPGSRRRFQRLRPGDIAVLVHARAQADAVRAALGQRGVPSVYLSDRDSVFASDEAADLLRLMQAVDQPRDLRLARAALATALLGLPWDEMLALASDELQLDRQCERLRELGEAWRGRGILAMVRQALHTFGLPARWLAGDAIASRGERRLTNVLHLAELLQAAALQARTPAALIAWLGQQIEDADQAPDGGEQVLRLESDADRVQVVTIHKSKGLEYPLVFVPFAAHVRELARTTRQQRDLVLMLPAAEPGGPPPAELQAPAGRELVLSPTAPQIEAAWLEQRREQLRLFYVAATRARHALWLGLSEHARGKGQPTTWAVSAPGHLLALDPSMPGAAAPGTQPSLVRDVRAHAESGDDIDLHVVDGSADAASLPVTLLAAREAAGSLDPAPAYRASFERHWAVTSYSQLMRGLGSEPAATGGALTPHTAIQPESNAGTVPARRVREDEPEASTAPSPVPPAVSQPTGADADADTPWHRFPRGATVGDFLHDQLEWLAGERFMLDASPELQQRLRWRCARQGQGPRADDVVAWLRQVCSRPLPALGAPLAGLATVAPEMEFWYPLERLWLPALDACCRRHILPGQARPPLAERALRGMMMGYADLVFEHGGRHWVLDHKSNTLGRTDADYHAEALNAAVLAHRYDVQAALYLLALHRLLRGRLGAGYEPSQHLGGALYLFLRGVAGPAAGCCALPAPRELLDELDAVLPASPQAPEGDGA